MLSCNCLPGAAFLFLFLLTLDAVTEGLVWAGYRLKYFTKLAFSSLR
uniref:Uncharacterized protein n=1 Tax=Aegilops tauschii subsp. strangulata TaxID=200361 RepID=A0A453N280_AEGTS